MAKKPRQRHAVSRPKPVPPSGARLALGRPTGLRKWLYRLAAVTLVPALLFGLLEVGLRIGGYGYRTAYFIDQSPPAGGVGYVANNDFSRRFFPPALARTPIPVALPAVKPAGTYRIFVLGESAAQGYPDPASSFPRILDVLLRDRYPDTPFQVVNTAMTAINSHAILPIARECAGHQPNLFLAYVGNNEVVGPFGAANVIGRVSPSMALIRSTVAVQGTRTGQLLSAAGRRLGVGHDAPQFWRGMEMFRASQVRAGDANLRLTHAHFRQNLDDICRAGVGAGAPVLVCTVPVNLRDCAPFASLHAPDLTPEQLSAWDLAYTAAQALEAAGKNAEAVARYEEAAWIDDQFADLQFRLGRCYAALGNVAEARRKYSLARDLDTVRFRSDTTVNETIRRVAEARAPDGVHLVDAEGDFAAASPTGVPGEDLFFEHVHLNFHGNYLLARSVLQKLHEILPPSIPARAKGDPDALSEQDCAERLAYTPWNEYQDVGQVREMFRQPPFTNQSDSAERERRWDKRLQDLRAQHRPEQLKQTAALYQKAVRRTPGDWMIRQRYAQVLVALGRVDEAIEQCQGALEHHPYVYSLHHRLGTLLLGAGRGTEARASFQAALRIAPDDAGAYYGLAEVLAAEGKVADAVAAYAEQVNRSPDRAGALVRMAGFLNQVGRPREAKERLKEAVQIQPDDPLLHVHLGNILHAEGALGAAIEQFETVLRLRPNWPEMADHLAALKKLHDDQRAGKSGR